MSSAGRWPRLWLCAGCLIGRRATPDSIAAAEAKLGDLSPRTVEAIESGMTRARKADAEGNKAACEAALAEVQRAIGP